MNCFLNKLKTFETESVCPGLLWKNGRFVPQKHKLHCCNGDGLYLTEAGARLCLLRSRLQKLDDLALLFRKSWGQRNLPELQKGTIEKSIAWLESLPHEIYPKGYCLKRNEKRPSLLWSLGAMTIWRFGYQVLWFDFGKNSLHQLQKQIEQCHTQGVIFIEQSQPIWKQPHLFEGIISLAENACFPVWADFLMPKENQMIEAKRTNPLASAFSKRIALKKAPPLAWVDATCHSRLKSVSHNSEFFC